MNNYIKNKLSKGVLFLTGIAVFSACTDNFLKPDPLSFYEPETTFATESGLSLIHI